MKMKIIYRILTISVLLSVLFANNVFSQNPIITDQFTADPSARVFNGKVYVFPSHDIPTPPEKEGRKDWFCMEDYHVFSSENLTEWNDHGVIVSQNKIDWVDSTSYSMWAPDCIERNGKYYFYFPSNTKVTGPNGRKGFSIGVAVAEKPEGPYLPQSESIKGIFGIDPSVFIDHDGQAYIYWSMGNIYVAKLNENMLELDSEPLIIDNLPQKGMKEGPWFFERNGIYYLTFPHVENDIERLEYAIGDNPMGPFRMKGVIMDESPLKCWTNHHSIVEYNKQWFLFYHQNAFSPNFDKNRSVCIDSLFFNPDGAIQKVIPTHRGVGLVNAASKIHIDRYSNKSESGVQVEFIDSLNTFMGWKTIFHEKDAWVKYNAVKFSNKRNKKIELKVFSEKGSKIQIRLDNPNGTLLSEVLVPQGKEWSIVSGKIANYKPGVHNIVVVLSAADKVEIDWIQFK